MKRYIKYIILPIVLGAELIVGLLICKDCVAKIYYDEIRGQYPTHYINFQSYNLNGADPDNVCTDLNGIEEFQGIYTKKAEITVTATNGKKTITSPAWIEDRHLSDDYRLYSLSEGEYFSDAQVGEKYGIIVGGREWADSVIGDEIIVTLNNLNGDEIDISAVICGRIDTPAVTTFLSFENEFASNESMIILPDIGIENYIAEPYSDINIVYTANSSENAINLNQYCSGNNITKNISVSNFVADEFADYVANRKYYVLYIIALYLVITVAMFIPVNKNFKIVLTAVSIVALISGVLIFSNTVQMARYVTREIAINTAIAFAVTVLLAAGAITLEAIRGNRNKMKKGTDNYVRLTD